MDAKNAETLLYQIMSGHTELTIEDKTLLVLSPTISQKRKASEVYHKMYESTAYDTWMTDNQNKMLLVSMGVVSKEIDENFKEIASRIEDLKVELFESIFDKEKRDKTRTLLNKVKSKQAEMLAERHKFDCMTRAGYADIIKTQYLIANTLVYESGERVFPDPDKASFSLLEKVISNLNNMRIGEAEMRSVARLDLWRGYWVVGKAIGNPFGKAAVELTDDQRLLCQLTRMYDSAFEHPECPSDDIIEDDDAFDGWLIKERRNNDKNKNSKMVDDLVGSKHNKATDVFVLAKNPDDARRINAANDAVSIMVKRQRDAVIKQKGTVHDAALPDQQQRIKTMATQLMSQSIRESKGH